MQYDARHKEKQAPHQTKSIIDAISWNWPRIAWMTVVKVMIKTVTKTKASATKQQWESSKILKEAKRKTRKWLEKLEKNQPDVWH